jgi:beta-alanine degradation protein BauB
LFIVVRLGARYDFIGIFPDRRNAASDVLVGPDDYVLGPMKAEDFFRECRAPALILAQAEKLYEDAQIRVARCTFPPGAVHVCHSHPAYLSYVLSGGQVQVQDEKGTRKVDIVTGTMADIPAIPWHEGANVGGTTVQFLNVEKKYQPAAPVSQTVCPKGTSK